MVTFLYLVNASLFGAALGAVVSVVDTQPVAAALVAGWAVLVGLFVLELGRQIARADEPLS